jgi:uroporphyrinogen-III synthase
MHLLVTRPLEDAEPLARKLQAMGHEVTIDPMLSLVLKPETPLDRTRVQALLVTSANGLRALAGRPDLKNWLKVPLFAVGPTTAAMAQALGFSSVYEAQGDVVSLSALSIAQLDPDGGPLVHVSGTVTAGDLKGTLERAGFWVETAVLYEAKAAEQLSKVTIDELSRASIHGVLLYSRRSAEVFRRLCESAGLEENLGDLTAYCLSGNVATPLQGLGFGGIQVATAPNETELLALIQP